MGAHGLTGFGLGTGLAALAAVLFAVGSVLQHDAVARASSADGLDLRALVRRPLWLAGQSATTLGSLVQVLALGVAPVSIVQPLLAAALVIALAIRTFRERCAPTGTELVGALCTVGGLAVFLAEARPAEGGPRHLPSPATVVIMAVGVAVLVALASRARRGVTGALACGVVAGVAAGSAAVLISAAFKQAGGAEHGVVGAVVDPTWWTTVVAALVAAVAAQLGSQQAYSRGALTWSLPALTVLDPLAAIPAARLALGERLEPGHAPIWVPAALVAVLGVVLLARTEAVCRRPLRWRPRS